VTAIGGLRISARSPAPSAGAALCALGAWWFVAGRARAVRQDLADAAGWIAAHRAPITVATGGIAGAIAIAYGSYSAAGSDASGYLSQAVMLWSRHLTWAEPLMAIAAWPDAATTLAPLGWRAAPQPGWQVPTYAVGLPLLMASLHAAGGILAASLLGPVSLVLAVWTTSALAGRLAGPHAAIIAALWLATSPVALIEAMQPMSDVPVTAAWLGCWLLVLPAASSPATSRSRSFGAGVVAGLAILIRPNLAPLAALPAVWLASSSRVVERISDNAKADHRPSTAVWGPFLRNGPFGSRSYIPLDREIRGAILRTAIFSAPVVIAGLVVAYLQWRYFGSPFRSGYGTAAEIYAIANLAPNAMLYTRWLIDTHGPWLLLAPAAAFLPGGRTLRWLLGFAALIVLAYLLYAVFEVWTYLRFLLPALAIAMIAVAAMAAAIIGRLPPAARAPVLAVLVLALAAANIHAARSRGVFRFAAYQSRAALAGRYLESALPPKTVVIAGEQSGAIRYYTGRSIVRWDFIEAGSLDRAIDQLAGAGYDLWIALDAWEEELFRQKFPATRAARLDWPPRVEAGSELLTRAWRIADREPFMRGERVITDRLR
jgi:hypothetical protein